VSQIAFKKAEFFFDFACPVCGEQLSARDSDYDWSVECPGCETIYRVDILVPELENEIHSTGFHEVDTGDSCI